jgi:Flp pilus assembly pilin Flp
MAPWRIRGASTKADRHRSGLKGELMYELLSLVSSALSAAVASVVDDLRLLFGGRPVMGRLLRDQQGQATVEYALVILGAATLALLLVAWAASTGRISDLLDRMMDMVGEKVG